MADQDGKRNAYVPLLSQICRHVFELYTSPDEMSLSEDFIPLADYSVASTIKSVGELASSFFFGGGSSTSDESASSNTQLLGGRSGGGGGKEGGEEEEAVLVFFVLGGVTSCEVKEIHQAMEETGMSNYGDVIVGATQLLTDVRNDSWNSIFMDV